MLSSNLVFVLVADVEAIKIQVVRFFPELNPSLLHYDVLADLFGLKSTRHHLIMIFPTPLLLETRRHGDLINHSLCIVGFSLYALPSPQQQMLKSVPQ